MFSKIINFITGPFRYHYVGKVTAYSITVDKNGNTMPGSKQFGTFILTESALRRKVTEIGDVGYSELANTRRGEVFAWKRGGPLPTDIQLPVSVESITEKPKVVIKNGNVLSFPDKNEDSSN